MDEGYFPIDGGDSLRVGVAGVLVFVAAWMWSLVTSLAVVRAIKVTSHRDTETQRTERERTGKKKSESRATGRTWDFLVTGTDTGVGKTVVAAGLVLALRGQGRRVVGFKPVETGVEPDSLTDSALLARASVVDEVLARPLASLREALAPAVAAERAGVPMTRDAIEARVSALRERYPSVVVEGAGGVAVPLAWGYTAIDLASALGLPAIVVARPGLGTLNHAWLTVEALRARGITVAAVILNGASSPPDLAEATNPAALARLLPGVRCLSLPRQDPADPWEVASRIAPLIASIIEH
jgi:dethiobiotin synthetase